MSQYPGCLIIYGLKFVVVVAGGGVVVAVVVVVSLDCFVHKDDWLRVCPFSESVSISRVSDQNGISLQ